MRERVEFIEKSDDILTQPNSEIKLPGKEVPVGVAAGREGGVSGVNFINFPSGSLT